jgi:hypothetical protein
MAYEAGTSESELVEFLNVAITESGCPGEPQRCINNMANSM